MRGTRSRRIARVVAATVLSGVAVGCGPAVSGLRDREQVPYRGAGPTVTENEAPAHDRSEPAKIVRDKTPYAVRGGERLDAHVYRRATASGDPVLVVMHGGSWRTRVKKLWAPYVPRLVRSGYVVIMPDVRLAPPRGSSLFPASVEDLSTAVTWVRHNASELGGDPGRVGLIGSSSGAHLALMAAGTGGGRPDAVAVFSPSIHLADLHRRNVTRNSIEKYLGCLPEECPDRYRMASPLTAMDERTPPTLLVYATDEIMPTSHGVRLARRLRRLGVTQRTLQIAGEEHGLKLVPRTLGETLDFMARHLARRP